MTGDKPLIKTGVEKVDIIKMPGHETVTPFTSYSPLDREQGEAAMVKLDKLLAGKKPQDQSATSYLLPETKTG